MYVFLEVLKCKETIKTIITKLHNIVITSLEIKKKFVPDTKPCTNQFVPDMKGIVTNCTGQ